MGTDAYLCVSYLASFLTQQSVTEEIMKTFDAATYLGPLMPTTACVISSYLSLDSHFYERSPSICCGSLPGSHFSLPLYVRSRIFFDEQTVSKSAFNAAPYTRLSRDTPKQGREISRDVRVLLYICKLTI